MNARESNITKMKLTHKTKIPTTAHFTTMKMDEPLIKRALTETIVQLFIHPSTRPGLGLDEGES